MIGQGCPWSSRHRGARSSSPSRRWLGRLVALGLLFSPLPVRATELSLRLRIEWGGGPACRWQGRIECLDGQLSDIRLLGLEADAVASIWLDETGVEISSRSPVASDGLDITVTAPADSRLIVGLTSSDGTAGPAGEFPLAQLVAGAQTRDLDSHGSRLTIRRVPGDALRVRSIHPTLVFAPSDAMRLEVTPYALSAGLGTRVRLEAQLRRMEGGDALWSKQHETTVGREPSLDPFPIDLTLPKEEGVYDLQLVAWTRGRLALKQVLAERRVQLVVVGDEPAPEPRTGMAQPHPVVTEIDPTNPAWWAKFAAMSRVPALQRGPWGNGQSQPWRHALGSFMQLGPGGQTPNVAWEAYPLTIHAPGKLHFLEVEYPSNVPQTLGISLVEPAASGSAVPVSLDSGLYVAGDAGENEPHLAKQQIPFWPRSRSPVVLLTNRREGASAVYGKIRAVAAPDGQLEHLFHRRDKEPQQRLLAGYLDRPLLPENFFAAEASDPQSQHSLDDWRTFQQSGVRLIEYLHHAGYNGLLLNVLADGATIYPSEVVRSTPRYDNGVLFSTGQDPQPKDVLELLYRLFDREGLRLVPVVQFATPLPALEALRRRGGKDVAGIELIGPEGRPWTEKYPPRHGLAPYYNPLDPRVQQAMLAVLHELAARYGQHSSYAGLAIQLSADGYAQMPGPRWGLDDRTIERFNQESGRQVPGQGPERFGERWAYLSTRARSEWLDWRARTLERFYRAAVEEITWSRADANLFLAATDLLSNPELSDDWRPALPRRNSLDRALLDVGISPDLQRRVNNVIFFRPQRVAPPGDITADAVAVEFNDSRELDRQFRAASRPAALFYHPPQETRLVLTDTRPGQRSLPIRLVSQLTPSEDRNRKRFVHSLATLDVQALCDGGWMLPLRQGAELQEFVRLYRQLPAEQFSTLTGTPQPVVIRTWSDSERTWIYLANDSPWPAQVQLRVAAPSSVRPESLGGGTWRSPGADGLWTVPLRPYDAQGAVFSAGDVQFSDPQVLLSQRVSEDLQARLNELQALAAALQTPAPLPVPGNRCFEEADSSGIPVGWSITSGDGVQARVDTMQPHEGKQSLRIASQGRRVKLTSAPFTPPPTGRLAVSVWLRLPDASQQPPVRMAIEGQLRDQEFYRYASVGAGKQTMPIDEKWSQYIFQVSDLPTEGLSPIQVRFDLLGAGELNIDQVQLYDMVFSKDERIELDSRIIALARGKLNRGEVSDCLQILEGYWPRFLAAHVPLTEISHPPQPAPATPPVVENDSPKEARKGGLFDRVRSLIPGRMR